MKNKNTIGIMDYGVGGLGLYKILRNRGFSGNIIYVSDSGYIPYGKLSRDELAKRIEAVLEFFRKKDAGMIAVACNAAGSVLENVNSAGFDLKNIIDSAVHEVKKQNIYSITVFAGELTVRSGIYQKLLEPHGVKVFQMNTQSLSIHIEAGDIGSDELKQLVKLYCQEVKQEDALLLACTHYPAIMKLFRQSLNENILIIDPAENLGEHILEEWNAAKNTSEDTFYTTGSTEKMKQAALTAFGIVLEKITSINID